MANGDRSKQLLANVRNAIGDEAGITPIGLKNRVYDALHRVQRRIAEDALCIEKKKEITVSGGEEFASFPDDMITEIKLIPSGDTALILSDLGKIDALKRLQQASPTETSEAPMYYYKWANKFGFLTSYGGMSTEDFTVTVYYYGFPDDDSEKISDTVDPLISSHWETCLFYGAVAELTQRGGWVQQYEAEFERRRKNEAVARSIPGQITYGGDYD